MISTAHTAESVIKQMKKTPLGQISMMKFFGSPSGQKKEPSACIREYGSDRSSLPESLVLSMHTQLKKKKGFRSWLRNVKWKIGAFLK